MSADEPGQSGPIDPSGLSVSSRLRAEADGELSPLDLRDDEVQDRQGRIAFERSLREAVGRVQSVETAPESLRTRIAGTLGVPSTAALSERVKPVFPREHPTIYRERLPWRRQLWLAAAAAVTLVTVLMLYGPLRISFGPPTFTAIAAFTTEQHEGCAKLGSQFKSKMTARTESEARKAAIQILPKVPSVLELHSAELARLGYRFAGLGRCAVPGRGRSAHLLYAPDPAIAPGAPSVSLFVQEDTGELAIDPNCRYVHRPTDPAAPSRTTPGVTMWRQDGLVYYLVAPPLPAEVLRAFDAPDEMRSIL
ncbi:MAG: hypothetical protein JNK58_06495 [Phycisphaerae bacterium]|nr:hypothetical protein [Phycisphaerae bacterium]